MGTKKGDKSDRPHIEFGSVLKRVLKKSRILQSDLTSALDVTNTSTISHYYRGKSLPPKKSLQIILAKIPDQHLRAELADAYNSDVNVVATESIDQTTVQEFFNGVFKLISCGEASLALTTAKKLAEESLDPLWQERLQDTIFRLHLRVGEYGSAAIHAKTLKKIEGQSPIVTATKSYGMLSIAIHSPCSA